MAVQLINSSVSLQGGGTTDVTPVGYCHEITLRVLSNGNISPNSFNFGNKGDINITKINFDVSDLINNNIINLNEYSMTLFCFDPSQAHSENNPIKFYITDNEWIIPSSLTLNHLNSSYKFILLIKEVQGVHTNPARECWISQEFSGSNNDTNWDAAMSTAIDNATTIIDNYGYLAKPPIILTLSGDHNSINISSNDLGYKFDNYVKRIQFVDSQIDEGFVNKYGVFYFDNNYVAYKFQEVTTNTYGLLLPSDFFTINGNIPFTLVATTENVEDNITVTDDGYKRWVSNTVTLTVNNNWLTSEDIEPVIPEPEVEQVGTNMLSVIIDDPEVVQFKVYIDSVESGTLDR